MSRAWILLVATVAAAVALPTSASPDAPAQDPQVWLFSGGLQCQPATVPTAPPQCDNVSAERPRYFDVVAAIDWRHAQFEVNWTTSGANAPQQLRVDFKAHGWNASVAPQQASAPVRFNVSSFPNSTAAFTLWVGAAHPSSSSLVGFVQNFTLTMVVDREEPTPLLPSPSRDESEDELADESPQSAPAGPRAAGPMADSGSGQLQGVAPETASTLDRTGWALAGGFLLALPAAKLLWGFVIRLFTRFDRDVVTQHPRRQRLLEAIAQNPGIHHEALRRLLGWSNGTFEHHAGMLRTQRLLEVRRTHDGRARYWLPGDRSPPSTPSLRLQIEDLVRRRPGMRQVELSRELGVSPQHVNYHVSRLVAQHRMKIERSGRVKRCYPTDGSASPSPAG